MFTFRRQDGYMLNNRTQEVWSWTRETFYKTLLDRKYDLNTSYFYWFILYVANKLALLFEACFGFALISFVNGLRVRFYLIFASVFMFPLLFMLQYCTNVGLSDQQRSEFYHVMGLLGLNSAVLDRTGRSKGFLILAVLITLYLFELMY